MNLIKTSFIIMFFICFLTGQANASVTYNSFERIITVTSEPNISLTEISDAISDSDAIWKDGNIWYINGSMKSVNSSISITRSDGSEVRMMGNRLNIWQLYSDNVDGKFNLENITISSWNSDTQQYATGKGSHIFYSVNMQNVTYRYSSVIVYGAIDVIDQIKCYNCNKISIENGKDIKIQRIYMEDSSPDLGGYAFSVKNSENITVSQIYINKTTTISSALGLVGSHNCTARYITGFNAGDYLTGGTPTTGSHGIVISGGSHNDVRHGIINYTGWSGLCPTGLEEYTYIENITVRNSGHNGIDIHPAKHIYMKDVDTADSAELDFLITSGYEDYTAAENITVNGFHIGDHGGIVDENNIDTYFLNGVLDSVIHTWAGIYTPNGSQIVTLRNITGKGGIEYWYAFNVKSAHRGLVINCNLGTIGRHLPESPYYEETVLFGNVNYTTMTYHKDMIIGLYPNLKVVDINGNPVKNANVVFNRTVYNAEGNINTTFFTDINGLLYNSGNISNHAIIPIKAYDLSGILTEYDSCLATATYGDYTGEKTLKSSEFMYSPNLTNLSGTQYTIILDKIVPVSNFSANIISGTVPFTVQFTDLSSTNTTSWSWDFDGDGYEDSKEQNPEYCYEIAGTYTVSLTISNEFGNNTETKNNYITANNPDSSGSSSSSGTSRGSSTTITIIPECISDLECTVTQICNNSKCESLECSYCEYAHDHKCHNYECCKDYECETNQVCQNHKCVEKTDENNNETNNYNIKTEAVALIDEVKTLIETYRQTKDTTEAENTLKKAILAFEKAEYQEAITLAEQAKELVLNAKEKETIALPTDPNNSNTIIYAGSAILISAIALIIFSKKKRPKTREQVENKLKLEEIEHYINQIRPIITKMQIENNLDPEYEKRLDEIEKEKNKVKNRKNISSEELREATDIITKELSDLKAEIEEKINK